MPVEQDDILDPAHDPDSGVENAGAAGIPKPGDKPVADELKVSEDGNVAEHKGVKYVRQEALHNERQERQKLAATLAALDPVMPEFEAFLKQKNERQSATVDRVRQSTRSESDFSDDELEGFAITRGYYEQDNVTPDTKRAQKELDIISGISRRQVAREVAPDRESTTKERARINRDKALNAKFLDGQPVASQQYVQAAIQSLGDEQLADPNVANLVQVIAAGLESLDQRKNNLGRGRPQRQNREPMLVEHSTGRFDGDDGEITDLDRAAARARGKSPEAWAKLSKQVNKVSSNRGSAILEDGV
jgi:hypothetical protein